MRMCWPSDSRQPCSAFSCIAVTTASPSGMDGERGVAALPFQLARAVGLRRDEPQRGAVVVRRRDALALGIERQAGDGGRVGQFLQLLAGLVEQMHELADRAGEQALALCRRGGWRRARPISCRSSAMSVTDAVGGDAAELAVVAAGDEAGWRSASGASARAAPSCTVTGRHVVAVGDRRRDARCRRPARKRRCVPARSKRAATTKASRSRWTPRVFSRNWAVVWLIGYVPSPNPLPHQGRGQLSIVIATPSPCGAGGLGRGVRCRA